MTRPLASIADNIRCKMAARRRIGFFDYHPLSEDMRARGGFGTVYMDDG